MRVWKRATGALKDRCSIFVAKLSPHGPCRNPDLETVIIKATSHDEQCMDYKNIQRVFQWLRTSPLYLKPLLYTLSMRMEKTHSWVVALKGLMLIHGVFCFDLPTVQRMGRLPFDLSHFSDCHINSEKAWGYNVFVRAYYSYLDLKSSFVSAEAKKLSKAQGRKTEETLLEELQILEKLQGLIDTLLQVKPRHQHMHVVLVLEAMDCVVDEVLEVYDRFCKGVDRALQRIYDMGGKVEAVIGLGILHKAETQGVKLSLYLDFCKEIGVLNASDYPKIMNIPENNIHELQAIINESVSEKKILEEGNEDKAIVVSDCTSKKGLMKTVITDQWEVFDDDEIVVDARQDTLYGTTSIVPYHPVNNYVLPDLISL